MPITEIPGFPRPPRCQHTDVKLRNGRCADCKRRYERWYCATRLATDATFAEHRRTLGTTGAARRKAERDAARAGQPNPSASRNKHKYADYLELIGKTDMAEVVRAVSLERWAELEPEAMAWMAAKQASRRPPVKRREKPQEQPSTADVEPNAEPSAGSVRPVSTGDPIVDAARRRAAGLP